MDDGHELGPIICKQMLNFFLSDNGDEDPLRNLKVYKVYVMTEELNRENLGHML